MTETKRSTKGGVTTRARWRVSGTFSCQDCRRTAPITTVMRADRPPSSLDAEAALREVAAAMCEHHWIVSLSSVEPDEPVARPSPREAAPEHETVPQAVAQRLETAPARAAATEVSNARPRTIEVPGLASSNQEIDMAASLVPCGACGGRESRTVASGAREVDPATSAPGRYIVETRCEACGARSTFVFRVDRGRWQGASARLPRSAILDPADLREELARLAPRIHGDPALVPEWTTWYAMKLAVPRARQCLELLRELDPSRAAEVDAEAARMRFLERRLCADEIRISERQWGRRDAKEEIAGLALQATMGLPSPGDLRRYYESRTIHARTLELPDAAIVIETKDDGAPDRLVEVRVKEDASGVVAALRFAAVTPEDFLGAGPRGPMSLLRGPAWDERKEDWERPLPDRLIWELAVAPDAVRVTLTASFGRGDGRVEARFWRERSRR